VSTLGYNSFELHKPIHHVKVVDIGKEKRLPKHVPSCSQSLLCVTKALYRLMTTACTTHNKEGCSQG